MAFDVFLSPGFLCHIPSVFSSITFLYRIRMGAFCCFLALLIFCRPTCFRLQTCFFLLTCFCLLTCLCLPVGFGLCVHLLWNVADGILHIFRGVINVFVDIGNVFIDIINVFVDTSNVFVDIRNIFFCIWNDFRSSWHIFIRNRNIRDGCTSRSCVILCILNHVRNTLRSHRRTLLFGLLLCRLFLRCDRSLFRVFLRHCSAL